MAPVPAKRYDLFIKAFEKEVAKAQERIAKMDKLMLPYEIVREALERAKLENDVRLTLSEFGVYCYIQVLPTDKESTFIPLLKQIGDELCRHRLHRDGIGSTLNSGYSFTHTWRLSSIFSAARLIVTLDVPPEGTPYIGIEETITKEMTEYRDRKLFWRDSPETQPDVFNYKEMEEEEEISF